MNNLPAYRFPELKDIFKVLMKFTPDVHGIIEITDEHAIIRLSRFDDGRMHITMYKIGIEYNTWIFQIILFNTNYTKELLSVLPSRNGIPSSFTYSKSNESVIKYIDNNIITGGIESTTLDYPIKEEQYFQKLTTMHLAPEEEFNYLMDSAIEWFSDVSTFIGFFICVSEQFSEEDETKFKDMVQYIVTLLNELYEDNEVKI